MGAFHAYDIRGIYNQDFNKDTVYRIGYFLPELLQTKTILVGRDDRSSSPEIQEWLTKGINDAGADVYDMGLSTTPMVYFTTANRGFKASVQITASHNPAEYNGLKVSRENALPVGYDTGLGTLEQWILNDRAIVPVPEAERGKIIEINVREEYLTFQRQFLGDLSNLHIAMDISNGCLSTATSARARIPETMCSATTPPTCTKKWTDASPTTNQTPWFRKIPETCANVSNAKNATSVSSMTEMPTA